MVDAETIRQLKALQPKLSSSGIAALYLFGSHARDEARPDSDVDLAFDVAPGGRFSVLDQAQLQAALQESLGRHVDFVERSAIHPFLQDRIARDLIRLF